MALDDLYDAHAQPLFAFLLNFTRDMEDTHDVLQDIFVKLARNPELLNGVREERRFLLRLAHNCAVDLMRRRSTRTRQQESFQAEAAGPFASSEDPDQAVFRAAMSRALGELPAEQRAVVHLRLWEGFTFEQIAVTLGIPLNTAGSRYRYGVDKLRELLRPLYEEIE